MLSHPILVKLATDDQGWPLIQFEPTDDVLGLVADFLQSDVDILLPSCDLLLEQIGAVLQGTQPRWAWNGNSFLVEVEKERTTITDKNGDGASPSARAWVDTDVLCLILSAWKQFVADLPRQRELAATQHAP